MARSKNKPGEGRKSKKKQLLENALGMPFDRIMTEKLPSNISRQDAAKLLSKLTDGEIKFGPSSIWNWVQDEQKEGRLVEFDFSGKSRESTTTPKKAILRKKKEEEKPKPETAPASVTPSWLASDLPKEPKEDIPEEETPTEDTIEDEEEEETPQVEMIELVGQCKCQSCNTEFEQEIECTDTGVVGLRAIRCPECEAWGSCVVVFNHNDTDVRKVIKEEDGHQHEIFVDEELHPVDNPFLVEEAGTP